MSESDTFWPLSSAAARAPRSRRANFDQFTPMPSDASSERTYRKLKEDWREATEHAEHLRRRLGRFQWREAAE
jgi:hypothetical protein